MNKDEIRTQWEKGLDPILVVDQGCEMYVLLEDPDTEIDNEYHCHRYFTIGDDWQVSVDEQSVDAEHAMDWLKRQNLGEVLKQ